MALKARRAMGSASDCSCNIRGRSTPQDNLVVFHMGGRRALGSDRRNWFLLAGDGLRP